jgi:hypothetical protein
MGCSQIPLNLLHVVWQHSKGNCSFNCTPTYLFTGIILQGSVISHGKDDFLVYDVWIDIFPRTFIPDSSPELVVWHSVSNTEHLTKYKFGEVVIWGPETEY